MIPFNIPPQVGTELDYMRQAMANNKICGDGPFTHRCDEWMEQRFHAGKVLLTTNIYDETPNLDALMAEFGLSRCHRAGNGCPAVRHPAR